MSQAAAGEVLLLSPQRALECLGSPAACVGRELSVLGRPQVLVVDLLEAGPAAAPQGPNWARARVALRELACPSVALCAPGPASDSAGAARSWCRAVDVLAEDREQLEVVLAAVRRNPLASLAFVQLLRHNERLDRHEGLIAESLVYSVLQSGPEFARWRASYVKAPPHPPPPRPAVRVLREADTLVLSLDRPERHNAFSVAMRDALVEGLELAACDESIREVVLRGEGPSFCSGGDLDEFGSFPDPATAHAVRSTRNAARLLAGLSGRARTVVHGACIGAGIELPTFGRHVAAREAAFFQLPELAMGLVPGAGGSVSLPRRIGRQRTAWMGLSGERVDLARALAWGLVDERLPAADRAQPALVSTKPRR